MFNKITKTFQFGDNTVTLEAGEIARQADGAVIVDIDGTSVMVTAVGQKEADPSRGFFPLTMNYQEKTYAAGKIPGGFFKREGRPTEKETLTCRLMDRPIRPLFPKGFVNEVQVIANVISLNKEVDPDIAAMLGASTALAISGLPFKGPIGASRVGYINNEYVLNPSVTQLDDSSLNLVVAGTDNAVLMVESEADILSEDVMLGAVVFGHEQMQVAITAIKEFAKEAGKPAWDWTAPEADKGLEDKVESLVAAGLGDAYQTADKMQRYEKVGALRDQAVAEIATEDGPSADDVKGAFSKIEKNIVRSRIIAGEARIDGREHNAVRDVVARVGVLPRTHGSALFTRGETQALVVATLGTERDAQLIDALDGTYKDAFMLHYNFPPSCVGETGFQGGPKRREIGHGKLAKRGVMGVMPDPEEYPYTLRVVSEITESNGSSSMASVCGTSLALMDAGVPISNAVAGIAMGLVKDDKQYAVLSDILGDEDHLGDMDFKVAGTREGITALQMDIKIDGITKDIMDTALTQAKEGRLFILDNMAKALDAPRAEISEYAPRFIMMKIHPDKIRDVIGKGGAVIRQLTEETGTSIDIEDNGEIKIASVDKEAGEEARRRIEEITADAEVGKIYEGKVAKIMDFGAFVTILPGRDGLVHISQIANERVENVADKLSEGDVVKVKVLEIDNRGKIRLSMKEVESDETATS